MVRRRGIIGWFQSRAYRRDLKRRIEALKRDLQMIPRIHIDDETRAQLTYNTLEKLRHLESELSEIILER